MIHGLKTYCGMCGDSGGVTIWHPRALIALRDGKRDLHTCVVACSAVSCKPAGRFTHRLHHRETERWLDRYGDQWWHCKATVRHRSDHNDCIWDVDADVAEFGTEMLQRFLAGKPANYVDAFDSFNAGEF